MQPGSGPSLNRAQHDAVNTLSGPLLVLAGAGTGKTRVITYRIAALIQSGIAPSRILAVTFTNKAAREMRQRALALLGKRRRGEKPPEISTFHSLCVRVLRRHAPLLGYPSEFAIYDRGDQETLARSALRDVRVSSEKLRPGDLLALIGGWKNRGLSADGAESAAEHDKEQLGAMAYARYQQGMKASGAMDFDDLLLKPRSCSRNFPRRASRKRRASTTCSWTSTKTRTISSTGSSSRSRTGTEICASSATTTSRSTVGVAPKSPTSWAFSATGRKPRSSGSRRTTARSSRS